MTATTRSPRVADLRRGSLRGLAAGSLLALAPKCLLCVASYAGLGALLGLGNRELCGAPTSSPAAWILWLPLLGAILASFGWLARRRRRAG